MPSGSNTAPSMPLLNQLSLTRLTLENFKAFNSETEIEFAPLTVLSGRNSSGKSSIYQAILLLKQSLNSHARDERGNYLPRLELNGKLVNLGNNDELLHNVENKRITMKLDTNAGYSKKVYYSISSTKNTNYFDDEFSSFLLSGLEIEDKYNFPEDCQSRVSVFWDNDKWNANANGILNFVHPQYYTAIQELFPGHRFFEIFNSEVSLEFINNIKIYLSSVIIQSNKRDFINILNNSALAGINFDGLIEELKKVDHSEYVELKTRDGVDPIDSILNGIEFIVPFRGFPKRAYTVEDGHFAFNFDRIKKTVIKYAFDKDGKPVSGKFSVALNYWLSYCLDEDIELSINAVLGSLVHEIHISGKSGKSIPLNNVGFGTSQLLPILYKCLSTPSGRLLIIDEPETHLHPSAQSRLADFLLSMVRLGRRIIVETHSEYILDKLIYHCVADERACEDLKMYWVQSSEEGSTILRIEYDEYGFCLNAPDGFLTEKTRLVEELTRRRIEKLESGKGR
jgi:predicted ATPase